MIACVCVLKLCMLHVRVCWQVCACVLAGVCMCAGLCMCRVGQNRIYTTYDRIFDDFPAKNYHIYTVYTYGSGQPYVCVYACVCACVCVCECVCARVYVSARGLKVCICMSTP
jgi:hypothetical protein